MMTVREFIYIGRRLVEAESVPGIKKLAFAYAVSSLEGADESFRIFYTKTQITELPVGAVFQAWASDSFPPQVEEDDGDGAVLQYGIYPNRLKRDEWVLQDIMAHVESEAMEAAGLEASVRGQAPFQAFMHPLKKLMVHRSMTPSLRRAVVSAVVAELTEISS